MADSAKYVMIILRGVDYNSEEYKKMKELVDTESPYQVYKECFMYKDYKAFSYCANSNQLAKEFINDWLQHVEYEARFFENHHYVTMGVRMSYRNLKGAVKYVEVSNNKACGDLIIWGKETPSCRGLNAISAMGHATKKFIDVYKNYYNAETKREVKGF